MKSSRKPFTSYSQVGQDRWAYEKIGDTGFFLDIGCGHPNEGSNTFGLEAVGWTGVLVDYDDYVSQLCRAQRKVPYIHADATKLDWSTIEGIPKVVDYLSLDVDAASLDALKQFMRYFRFKVATIEHDSYRFGNGSRDEMRRILETAGYTCAFKDVESKGMPFEDWCTA